MLYRCNDIAKGANMSIVTLFHGSNHIIKKPELRLGKETNDYGQGFYCTELPEMAKEWACKNNEVGLVNKYQIRGSDFNSLKILDLTNKDEYNILNWIAILMHFRNLDLKFRQLFDARFKWLEKFYIDVNDYDVVKGFRADDAYFAFPQAFVMGQLSLERLQKVFVLGNLGIQYAFMSEKAISKIKFVSSQEIEQNYIGKYYGRIKSATEEYRNILNEPIDDNETFIRDLMNKYE